MPEVPKDAKGGNGAPVKPELPQPKKPVKA